MINNERERLLCYSAGIIGSYLANPNYNRGIEVDQWMINRAIKYANMIITTIYNDEQLKEILK